MTRLISEGGVLERKGLVEVISSLEANGRQIPYDIRMGVWVTVEAETEYIKNCFEEYDAHTDPGGRNFTLHKRWHLTRLEVGLSAAACRHLAGAGRRAAGPGAWREGRAASESRSAPELGERGNGHHDPRLAHAQGDGRPVRSAAAQSGLKWTTC